MEHYTKGKVLEEPFERALIPIPSLPSSFIWLKITNRTKVENVLNVALRSFKDDRNIIWSASGEAVEHALYCVKIMKRRFKNLYQITKYCYRKSEEYWIPNMDGLDELVVIREIPTVHILLSKDQLDPNEPGYQYDNQPEKKQKKNKAVVVNTIEK